MADFGFDFGAAFGGGMLGEDVRDALDAAITIVQKYAASSAFKAAWRIPVGVMGTQPNGSEGTCGGPRGRRGVCFHCRLRWKNKVRWEEGVCRCREWNHASVEAMIALM